MELTADLGNQISTLTIDVNNKLGHPINDSTLQAGTACCSNGDGLNFLTNRTS